jgi:hypothetical protein
MLLWADTGVIIQGPERQAEYGTIKVEFAQDGRPAYAAKAPVVAWGRFKKSQEMLTADPSKIRRLNSSPTPKSSPLSLATH